ncbi:hypothetical protein TURU_008633 [Turdus rufiventris]|nr:hypothetical protein TURU_008633 [Turdus rufiventris]
MVIRDLTLRSAASFGSFHLIRLLYDEYMFYLVEHRVAQATGETPIAVMGEFGDLNAISPGNMDKGTTTEEGSLEHDCVEVIEYTYLAKEDLKDVLLEQPVWELLTDGSSFVENGTRYVGYAEIIVLAICPDSLCFIPQGLIIAQAILLPEQDSDNTPESLAMWTQVISCHRPQLDVPSVNQQAPLQRYHWVVLPRGMENSPTICQWFVDQVLDPVLKEHLQTIIYHYMDDILIASETSSAPDNALMATTAAVQQSSFTIAEDKIQQMPPWKY